MKFFLIALFLLLQSSFIIAEETQIEVLPTHVKVTWGERWTTRPMRNLNGSFLDEFRSTFFRKHQDQFLGNVEYEFEGPLKSIQIYGIRQPLPNPPWQGHIAVVVQGDGEEFFKKYIANWNRVFLDSQRTLVNPEGTIHYIYADLKDSGDNEEKLKHLFLFGPSNSLEASSRIVELMKKLREHFQFSECVLQHMILTLEHGYSSSERIDGAIQNIKTFLTENPGLNEVQNRINSVTQSFFFMREKAQFSFRLATLLWDTQAAYSSLGQEILEKIDPWVVDIYQMSQSLLAVKKYDQMDLSVVLQHLVNAGSNADQSLVQRIFFKYFGTETRAQNQPWSLEREQLGPVFAEIFKNYVILPRRR